MSQSPVDLVLERLGDHKLRQVGRGAWTARCPAHEDKTPSLSIREGEDGRVLIHCHTGCTPDHVVGALGLELVDLFPRDSAGPARGVRTATYRQALEAIKAEALLVAVAAKNLAAGHALTPVDLERLQLAQRRIAAAAEAAGL